MVKALVRTFLCVLLTQQFIYGCPTCVGRVTYESPPFFSKEFYTSHIQTVSFDQSIVFDKQRSLIKSQGGNSHEES